MKGVISLLLGVIFFLVVVFIVVIFLIKYTSVVNFGVQVIKVAFEPFI